MSTGILITARLGSTRLKRKHLLDVNGRPLLEYLVKRIINEFSREINNGKINLFIATSDEPENRSFEMFAGYGVKVFYGSTNNIPLRHLQAAREQALDSIVAVDGDDILCSVRGMRNIYEALSQETQYVKTTDLPFGMNSFGYTTNFLESSLASHSGDVLETGWGRIFDPAKLNEIPVSFSVQDDLLRFTLDYEEDFAFFKAVIEAFGDDIYSAADEDIVNYVLDNRLFKINESRSKEYWDNFYKNIEKEAHQNES